MVRFDSFFLFLLSVLGERHILRIEKKKMKKKPTLAEGEFCGNKIINSFCRVSPINAASYA